MRQKIYQMVHGYEENPVSIAYKYFMIAVITLSLIPLAIKEPGPFFRVTDLFCLTVYIIDYILRLMTADYKLGKHHWTSFVRYPFPHRGDRSAVGFLAASFGARVPAGV